jgi:O-antigen/teichoic acid export membrane protein
MVFNARSSACSFDALSSPVIGKLFSDSLTYAVPTILTRGIGLVLLPVYARNLEPAQYGTVEVLTLTYVLLNLVLPLELSQAVARFGADARTARERDRYASVAFSFTVIAFAIWVLAAWTIPLDLLNALVRDRASAELMPLASVWMLVNALLYVVLNQLRWNGLPRAYALVNVVFTATVALVSIVLIARLKYGAHGYVWGQLAGSVIALALGWCVLRKGCDLRFIFGGSELKRMLIFSAPLVLSSIAVYATSYVDRWLLVAWRGPEELGLYAVGARVASLISVATIGVQLALTPLIYTHSHDSRTPPALRQFFRLFLLGVLALIAVIASFAPEIVRVLAGDTYAAAASVVPWLAIGQVLANLYIFAPGLILSKKTGRIAAINVMAAAVNVVANTFLIRELGMYGAALGMAFATAVLAGLYFRSSERYYVINYEWRRCSFAALATLVLIIALQLGAYDLFWRGLACLTVCVVLALALVDKADAQLACSRLLGAKVD